MCPSSAIKILIIKSYFLTVLCADWWKKKRVNKHLMIDLLWMTIHLDINNRKPYHFGVGVKSQKQCAQGSSKTLKTGWPVLLGQIVFFIINNNDNAIPPRHSELCRTNCMCINVTIISFCWVQNVCSSVLCT